MALVEAQIAWQIKGRAALQDDARRRVLLAVEPQCTDEVANALKRMNAVVEFAQAPVGYLRVSLPAGSEARSIARLPAVNAVLIMANRNPISSAVNGTSHAVLEDANAPRPLLPASLPAENPYTSAVGIGAERFRAKHPTFDGRGTAIAILDPGIDPSLPQLRHALTLQGKWTHKVADIVMNAQAGSVPSVTMGDIVSTDGATVRYKDFEWRAPAAGTYRIGQSDKLLPAEYLETLQSSSIANDGDAGFALLWNEHTGTVWVDTNRNRDFTDDPAMRDYAERSDTATLRPSGCNSCASDPINFAIKIDRPHHRVHVVMSKWHAVMSVSSAAGSAFFGGEAGGVAPAARVFSTTSLSLENFILASAHPEVDVVMSYLGGDSASVGSDPRRSLFRLIERRVVDLYGKPTALAAGNGGPGLSSSSTSISDDVLTTGAYSSAETWLANYGIQIARSGQIRDYSGRGPAFDGGPGPRILAPTGYLVPTAPFSADSRRTPYVMPKGYRRGGGTSQATPTVAGALALLASAAKQENIAHDARRLSVALITSARPLDGCGAHEQGAGLFDIERAWEVLRRLKDSPVRIEAQAPVRTPWSESLATPGLGRGLYEIGNWHAGDRATRMIHLRRTTGPEDARHYQLEWSSNDGSYEGPAGVTLPLNSPVAVRVKIHPRSAGVHGAFLNVIDPGTQSVVHQVLHTVVVAEPLTAANGFEVRYRGRQDIARSSSFFVDVPRHCATLHAVLASSGTPVSLKLVRPAYGLTSSGQMPTSGGCDDKSSHLPQDSGSRPAGMECVVQGPDAGVWEAIVQYPAGFEGYEGYANSDPHGIDYELTIQAVQSNPEGKIDESQD